MKTAAILIFILALACMFPVSSYGQSIEITLDAERQNSENNNWQELFNRDDEQNVFSQPNNSTLSRTTPNTTDEERIAKRRLEKYLELTAKNYFQQQTGLDPEDFDNRLDFIRSPEKPFSQVSVSIFDDAVVLKCLIWKNKRAKLKSKIEAEYGDDATIEFVYSYHW